MLTRRNRTSIEDLATFGYELSEENLRLAGGQQIAPVKVYPTYIGLTYHADGTVDRDNIDDVQN